MVKRTQNQNEPIGPGRSQRRFYRPAHIDKLFFHRSKVAQKRKNCSAGSYGVTGYSSVCAHINDRALVLISSTLVRLEPSLPCGQDTATKSCMDAQHGARRHRQQCRHQNEQIPAIPSVAGGAPLHVSSRSYIERVECKTRHVLRGYETARIAEVNTPRGIDERRCVKSMKGHRQHRSHVPEAGEPDHR